MPDSEGEGAVHMLVVRELGDPSIIDGLRPIEDYEIQHPWCCPQEERSPWPGGPRVLVWTCDIGWMENDGDLAFSLKYSGTEVTAPGLYLIQAWWRKYYCWDYGSYEYNNGIGVIAARPNPAIGIALEHSIQDPVTGEASVRVRLT
jgi:hypothetical protein